MSLFGPPNIAKLEQRGDVPNLIKALDYQKNPQIRKAAIRSLGVIGDPSAFDALVVFLKDEDPIIRSLTITALGRLGDARAVPILIHRIRKQGADACREELSALKQIGLASLEPLLDLLQKKIEDTRLPSAVMEACLSVDDPKVLSLLLDLFPLQNRLLIPPVADTLARIGDSRAAPRLVETLLSGPDEDWAASVAEALNHLGWRPKNSGEEAAYNLAKRLWGRLAEIGGPAIDVLIPVLSKGRAEPILKTAAILGAIGDERSVEPLTALLSHKKPDIAVAAALALGAIQSASAVGPLFQAAVDSPQPGVRDEAEKALIRIGRSAVSALIPLLNSGAPRERKLAVQILGRIGDREAAAPLAAALDDTTLHPELLFALDRLHWRPDNLPAEIDFYLKVDRFDRLLEIGEPAVEPLIAALSEYPDRLFPIIETLGRIGDPQALEAIFSSLENLPPKLKNRQKPSDENSSIVIEALKSITGRSLSSYEQWRAWWAERAEGSTG